MKLFVYLKKFQYDNAECVIRRRWRTWHVLWGLHSQ